MQDVSMKVINFCLWWFRKWKRWRKSRLIFAATH